MSARIDAPRFSIITPVCDPPPEVLTSAIASVVAQTDADWQLCLVDDASESPAVRVILDDVARRDPRVTLHRRNVRGGIAVATNDALARARGEFVAFLDHDDELHPNALEAVRRAMREHDDVDYLYTDEDKIDVEGRHSDPFCKPDWSPDRFRVQMYTAHLSVARRSLVEEVGPLDPVFDGAQDWDLVLRVTEKARRVVHVPEILYHWRTLPSSTSVAGGDAKPHATEAARRAIDAHLARTGVQGECEPLPGYAGLFRIRPRLSEAPFVSIVMPTAGSRRVVDGIATDLVVHSVDSIVRRTTYTEYEIVVVVDTNVSATTRRLLDDAGRGRVRQVPYERPFNFSDKVNVGVAGARGEHLLFCNDDIELLPDGWHPGASREGCSDWIQQLLVYSLQPGVGGIGARLYFPDGRLQHAGIVSVFGAPTHALYMMEGEAPGYFGAALLTSNYLAVTGACLMTRREAFDRVGGFDVHLPLNYNDVAYCLALRDAGMRSVYVPDVQLLHFESATRPVGDVEEFETRYLFDRWDDALARDPYYPAAFLPDRSDFALPKYRSNGTFVHHGPLLRGADRARELMAEGGPRLVARRAYGKIRRRIAP
jgi:glycosyltransferase involved in cell wall biosynthesis